MGGSFWDRWNPLVLYRSECGGWYLRLFYRSFHIIPL
jgi:hypothetical protein